MRSGHRCDTDGKRRRRSRLGSDHVADRAETGDVNLDDVIGMLGAVSCNELFQVTAHSR
jgi:hypothetical protein